MVNKENLDSVYDSVIVPLENYAEGSSTAFEMLKYMEVFGDVMQDFTIRMNKQHRIMVEENPEQKKEIEEYILSLKNKLVETYKPK